MLMGSNPGRPPAKQAAALSTLPRLEVLANEVPAPDGLHQEELLGPGHLDDLLRLLHVHRQRLPEITNFLFK